MSKQTEGMPESQLPAPQVLSLVAAPALLEHPEVGTLFASDAIARAKQLLTYFPGGLGAYSDSRGAEGVRKEIAEFITQRDGYPSDPNVRKHSPTHPGLITPPILLFDACCMCQSHLLPC
jgi:hypothetical protein